jgi:hypothetical protein
VPGVAAAATPERQYLTRRRLLSGLPGALVCAGGIFMYGFTAIKTHFMVVSDGIFLSDIYT